MKAVGPVDVLCSHVPPNLAQLRYDVVPGRLEMYGPGLLESIDEHRPGAGGLRARAPADQPGAPAADAPSASTSATSSGFPQPFEVDLR